MKYALTEKKSHLQRRTQSEAFPIKKYENKPIIKGAGMAL